MSYPLRALASLVEEKCLQKLPVMGNFPNAASASTLKQWARPRGVNLDPQDWIAATLCSR